MDMIEIGPLGGIRNFGWLQAGWLARGEQPPLDDETLEALAAAGIQSVISLRAEAEREGPLDGRLVPQYAADLQRAACERAGLRFHHLGCTDFMAPSPEEVAQTLRAIDAMHLKDLLGQVHANASKLHDDPSSFRDLLLHSSSLALDAVGVWRGPSHFFLPESTAATNKIW